MADYANDPAFDMFKGESKYPNLYGEGGGNHGGFLAELGNGIKDDVIFGLQSIPYLPAAIAPSNGTMGFLDESVDPEELRHRRRALADATMLLAGWGMGSLAAKVAAPGGAGILRTILGGAKRATAVTGAVENTIFSQINKAPGEETNILGDAALGAGLGLVSHGLFTKVASKFAKKPVEALAQEASQNGTRALVRVAEEEMAGSWRPQFTVFPDGTTMTPEDWIRFSAERVSNAEVLPDEPVQQRLLNAAHGVDPQVQSAYDENSLFDTATAELEHQAVNKRPSLASTIPGVPEMMRKILAERLAALAGGDVSWVDDAARRAARASEEGPKRLVDLLEGDYVLPSQKKVVASLHAEASHHEWADRNARLNFASQVLGRPVTTFSDITSLEALNVTNAMRVMRGETPIIPMRTPALSHVVPVRGGHAVLHFDDAEHKALFNLVDRMARETVPEEELARIGQRFGLPPTGVPAAAQMYKDFVLRAARAGGPSRLSIPTFEDFIMKLPDFAVREREEIFASLTNRVKPATAAAAGGAGKRVKGSPVVKAAEGPKMTRAQALEKARAAKAAKKASEAVARGETPAVAPPAPKVKAQAVAAPAEAEPPKKGSRAQKGPRGKVEKVQRRHQSGEWKVDTKPHSPEHGPKARGTYLAGDSKLEVDVARRGKTSAIDLLGITGHTGNHELVQNSKAMFNKNKELLKEGKITSSQFKKLQADAKILRFRENRNKETRRGLQYFISDVYNNMDVRVINVDPKSPWYKWFKQLEAEGFMAEGAKPGQFGLKAKAAEPPAVKESVAKQAAPANLRPKDVGGYTVEQLNALARKDPQAYESFIRKYFRSRGFHPVYHDLPHDHPVVRYRDALRDWEHGKIGKKQLAKIKEEVSRETNKYNKELLKAQEKASKGFGEAADEPPPGRFDDEPPPPSGPEGAGGAPVVVAPKKPSGGGSGAAAAATPKKPGAIEFVASTGQKVVRPNSTIMFHGEKAKALGVSVEQAVDGSKQAVVLVEANGSTVPVPLHTVLDENPSLLTRPHGEELKAASLAIQNAKPSNTPPLAVEKPTPVAEVAQPAPLVASEKAAAGKFPGVMSKADADKAFAQFSATNYDGSPATTATPGVYAQAAQAMATPEPAPPAPVVPEIAAAMNPKVTRLMPDGRVESKELLEEQLHKVRNNPNMDPDKKAKAVERISRALQPYYDEAAEEVVEPVVPTVHAVPAKVLAEQPKIAGMTDEAVDEAAMSMPPSQSFSLEQSVGGVEEVEVKEPKKKRVSKSAEKNEAMANHRAVLTKSGLMKEAESVHKMLLARRFDPNSLSPEQIEQVRSLRSRMLAAGTDDPNLFKVVYAVDKAQGKPTVKINRTADGQFDSRELDRIVNMLRSRGVSESYINDVIDRARKG